MDIYIYMYIYLFIYTYTYIGMCICIWPLITWGTPKIGWKKRADLRRWVRCRVRFFEGLGFGFFRV